MLNRIRKQIIKYFGSYQAKLDYNLFSRPSYAYGVYHAALLASRLVRSSVSVVEFGVAGGNGLIALQQYASQVTEITGVSVKVIGLDSGKGMPPPEDPRDLGYIWFEGDFKMDEQALRSKIQPPTELKIGLLQNTVSGIEEILRENPLGAAFFDVDYYSSTVEAMSVFDLPSECYLPRVLCVMDNIISRAEFPINEFVGELAAINLFNQSHDQKKIGKLYAFHCKRRQAAAWNWRMFVFQDFEHPEYGVPVRERRNEKTKLRS